MYIQISSLKIFLLRITIAFIFLFCNLNSYTQSSESQVRILVLVQNATLEIDGELTSNGKFQSLSIGPHRVRAWAEKFDLKDTIINVTSKPEVFKIRLNIDPDYETFLKQKKEYRNNKASKLIAPQLGIYAGASALYLLGESYFLKRSQKRFEQASRLYEVYQYSLDYTDITEAKKEIEELERKFLNETRNYYITTALSIVSGLTLSYVSLKKYHNKHKMTKPVYQSKNKLTIDGIGFNSSGKGSFMLSINFNLN